DGLRTARSWAERFRAQSRSRNARVCPAVVEARPPQSPRGALRSDGASAAWSGALRQRGAPRERSRQDAYRVTPRLLPRVRARDADRPYALRQETLAGPGPRRVTRPIC